MKPMRPDLTQRRVAPGAPGLDARWTSSAKSGVGTSIGGSGRVWFTLSHGILNEIYYPRVDQACTRDMGLIVTGPNGYFSEEKRHTHQKIQTMGDGIQGYRVTNTSRDGYYRIIKEIIAHPHREVVLQRVTFEVLRGTRSDYRLYGILAPHLRNAGNDNSAIATNYKGFPILAAYKPGRALAFACSVPWVTKSVGYVGQSDGWQQLRSRGWLAGEWTVAENGNVALTGEIPLETNDTVVLAIGFGQSISEAGHRTISALHDDFDLMMQQYCNSWEKWQSTVQVPELPSGGGRDLFRVSASVLASHESALFPGGIIASLSLPWGAAKGDGDLGGYHLVWPRDLVMSAGALLATGAGSDVRRVLRYLWATQEADGRWPQNMWLDGTPFWSGVQLDEVGLPILLVDLARRYDGLSEHQVEEFWPMVRKAVSFIVMHGPLTDQDRWEEDQGYTPFTMAIEISALLVAAELADKYEPGIANYLRETADAWNGMIDNFVYVTDTRLTQEYGVDGYYVRIAPQAGPKADVVIKNRPGGDSHRPASEVVSTDALALVRFGLRAPNDPRILNTIKVIDALTRVELPDGSCWYRYDGDGYGEHSDGSPFDGIGKGRPWPLLTGERAHYELAAGNRETAISLLRTFAAFANDGGLLPEQTWDTNDIPSRGLHRGHPAGSAMPLCWAHAEYIKLRRSLADNKVFDTPPLTVQRYQVEKKISPHTTWRFGNMHKTLPSGTTLRIETLSAATIHWTDDGWATFNDIPATDTGIGVFIADLTTSNLAVDRKVIFTLHWTESDNWEGTDFSLTVTPNQSARKL